MPRRISRKGVDFIKRHERFVHYAYDDLDASEPRKRVPVGGDVKGTLTIGYGHTRTARPGMSITEETAEELLREDLERAERALNSIPMAHELLQHEFDALVSFVFNVGPAAFNKSTLRRKLDRLLASRADPLLPRTAKKAVAQEFLRWRFSKGIELRGLVKRRSDERSLFLGLTSGD